MQATKHLNLDYRVSMSNTEIIGLIAAVLTTASFIPQVYVVWKEKSVKDISLAMYTIFFMGLVLWLYYGIEIDSLSIILANAITIILVVLIIIAKFKFK